MKFLYFWSILGCDSTTKSSQKTCSLYILWKKRFIDYHILSTHIKKLFLSWRNRPFNNTLIFEKLELLWQQTIHQEIPFYLVYKLTKFNNHSISQTGFTSGGIFLHHPGRIQGPKSPGEIGLSDCNRNRIQNHLFHKRTLNHLTKLTKWLSCFLSTYLYCAFDCILLSCNIRNSEWIHAL